jgi:hypothetical protein
MEAVKQQGCRNGQRNRSYGVPKTLLPNEKIKYFNIRRLKHKLGAWKIGLHGKNFLNRWLCVTIIYFFVISFRIVGDQFGLV